MKITRIAESALSLSALSLSALSLSALSLSSTAAFGGITSLDLSNYQLSASYALPSGPASEASAVAYNPDTGNLLVLGDEGDALAEVTKTGALVSTMTLTGFDDTEGLTYIGGGRYVLVEERLQDAFVFTYAPGGTIARSSLQSASLGDTIGNIGLEGISFDPRDGKYVVVKEKDPQAVRSATIDFTAGTASVQDLFTPSLGVTDLSDVQVAAAVPSLIGTADEDNLLIYSQESGRLLEVTRGGVVLSQFDFSSVSTNTEGVTIDTDGVIYLCDESPMLYVLTPVPEPGAAALIALASAAATIRRRRCA